MMVLAAANLAFLAVRLWPWEEIGNLPVNGSAAYDPALLLLVYLGLAPWIASGITPLTRRALSVGAVFGTVAGSFLVVETLPSIGAGAQSAWMRPALLAAATVLWGVAGIRGSKIAGTAAMGALSGLWAAMFGSLMVCTAVLAELYLAGSIHQAGDAWKQYEGLAVGSPAMQNLVHTLNTATEFLLLGPIVGTAAGLVFGFFAQEHKA